MDSFNNYLKQFPKYTPKVFESVLPYLSIKNLSPGDHLLTQGDICRNVAFIEEGFMRLYYYSKDKEVTNCFCKENTMVTSYTSLITQQESNISIQAIEPSKLILLSNHSLQKLYDLDPFWQQLGRLATENEYITTECHHRFLSDLTATERYLQVLENDGELLQRVPLIYLATYLQITPETLSRIRKKISRT